MTFFQTQVDKLTTVLLNKWVIVLLLAVLLLGMTKQEIIKLIIVGIQECGFK